ncbi:MAG: transposase [Planctomycetes bacterium]|nr:transposase [Planctomycetota bacterium]
MQGRVALGAKSGARAERLGRRREVEFERPLFIPGSLCCDIEQFSLHAKVRIEAQDREGLERLCRYIARPPIKVERHPLLVLSGINCPPDGFRRRRLVHRRYYIGTSRPPFVLCTWCRLMAGKDDNG